MMSPVRSGVAAGGCWMRGLIILLFGLAVGSLRADAPYYSELEEAPHRYSQRALRDPFTLLQADLDAGRRQLDSSSPLSFLRSLLRALDVPVESQVMVFSTTSLQSQLIGPGNPRALYFSEDVYVGYIPGGKIEIVSLDPDLGGIFSIFPIPRGAEKLQVDRSGRCLNCHANADSRYMPGLVIESVVPAPGGGSLDAFRQEETGHQIPYDQRFGGWYVTGQGGMTNHWGNLTGRMRNGEITTQGVAPGERFDFGKYPTSTSDLLAHLLHEHQAGFVNRALEATYRARFLLHLSNGQLSAAQSAELDQQARELVRYLLFSGEPPLPAGGVPGDAAFKRAFLANRRVTADGRSLKDFDLRQRLFAHRCSYMIYSGVFGGLPKEMKSRVYRELASALREEDTTCPHLPAAEKQSIRAILKETLPGLPSSF